MVHGDTGDTDHEMKLVYHRNDFMGANGAQKKLVPKERFFF